MVTQSVRTSSQIAKLRFLRDLRFWNDKPRKGAVVSLAYEDTNERLRHTYCTGYTSQAALARPIREIADDRQIVAIDRTAPDRSNGVNVA